ncbi:MAG: hypothetical protein QM811_01565 [Pirellulales bacterium]
MTDSFEINGHSLETCDSTASGPITTESLAQIPIRRKGPNEAFSPRVAVSPPALTFINDAGTTVFRVLSDGVERNFPIGCVSEFARDRKSN